MTASTNTLLIKYRDFLFPRVVIKEDTQIFIYPNNLFMFFDIIISLSYIYKLKIYSQSQNNNKKTNLKMNHRLLIYIYVYKTLIFYYSNKSQNKRTLFKHFSMTKLHVILLCILKLDA